METQLLPTRRSPSPWACPNANGEHSFRISWILVVIRICLMVLCGWYTFPVHFVDVDDPSKRKEENLPLLQMMIILLSLMNLMTFVFLCDPSFNRFHFKCFHLYSPFLFVIQTCFLAELFYLRIKKNEFLYFYAAGAVTCLIIDCIVWLCCYKHYRKLFENQRIKLTLDLERFFTDTLDVNNLVKRAESGYFTEVNIPRKQITGDSTGVDGVAGGLVLVNGELVYYCDAQEYFSGAEKLANLQAREISMKTEQRVLAGHNIDEDNITFPLEKKSKECRIGIEAAGTEPNDRVLKALGPPGGYFSCLEENKNYVLLKDCRAIHRDVIQTEQRLETLRAENRVLRDVLKKQWQKEQANDEPKDEKVIDDVD